MNVRRNNWAIAFAMMVFGILISTQLRVQQLATVDTSKARADELTQSLKASDQALKASETERVKLTLELDQLRKQASSSAPVPPKDTTGLEMLSGTLDVQGPGVIVTLSESPDVAPGKARVSDEDIWRVLNELLSAGAEAISVGGQRVTAVTGIRNVGQRILVGGIAVPSPVEILAVGDPKVMEPALLLRGGVFEALDKWGIKATVKKSETIRVPAKAAPILQWAKPVQH